jgi:hypothetical protein
MFFWNKNYFVYKLIIAKLAPNDWINQKMATTNFQLQFLDGVFSIKKERLSRLVVNFILFMMTPKNDPFGGHMHSNMKKTFWKCKNWQFLAFFCNQWEKATPSSRLLKSLCGLMLIKNQPTWAMTMVGN